MGVKRFLLASAIFGLAIAAAGTATSKVFDFSYSGAGVSGSGVITTGNSGSPYTILAYPAPQTVTLSQGSQTTPRLRPVSGLLRWIGVLDGRVRRVASPTALPIRSGACCGVSPLQFSVTAVPEPSLWATLLLGVGAAGMFLRSRRRDQAAVATQRIIITGAKPGLSFKRDDSPIAAGHDESPKGVALPTCRAS